MSNQHMGNTQPAMDQEEHSRIGGIDGKKIFVFDNAGNQITSFGSSAAGNSTVSMPGGATVYQGTSPWTTSLSGNVTISDSKGYIGLVSANIGGSLPAGAAYIGLATVNIGTNVNTNIGLVTVSGGQVGLVGNNTIVLGSGIGGIGFATVNIGTNVNTNIGLVTVAGGAAWADPKTYVGLTTTTLGVGTTFIGLATTWDRNAGTTKTLINIPIAFSTASITTLATPTNANSIYVTSLVLNSNATVRVTLKSGVTYLTGNASIGLTLLPGGGLVMTGSPDSPSWIGLPSGPLNVEKLDLTATSAQISGNVVYFQE